MRFLPFFAVLFLLDLYAFQAVCVLIASWPEAEAAWLSAAYWSVPALVVVLLLAHQRGRIDWDDRRWTLLRSFLIILYLSKFLIAGGVLVDDLRRMALGIWEWARGTGPADLDRSPTLSAIALALGGIPLVTLTYGMLRNPYRYQVLRQKVRIPGLPAALEGLRIVQISDIHSGSFTRTEPLHDAIRLIDEQRPDLVFFTGDLVNNQAAEMEPYREIFAGIRAKYGVYSVLGNHDYGDYVGWPDQETKVRNFRRLVDLHRQMGWELLRNEHRVVPIGNATVGVIGVENASAHPRFHQYGDLRRAVEGLPEVDLQLLLSHDPSHWRQEVTSAFPQIALTFSGHTHGMQFGIEIPGVFKWSPIQYVYREWAGLYREGNQYLYVNRGLGFLGYPGRVGILPEITVVELVGS